MRSRTFLSLASCATLMITTLPLANAGSIEPQHVPARFAEAYVPGGYDSNDVVQLVAEGFFPNGCFRPGRTVAKVDAAKKIVWLDSEALFYDGVCPQMIVPFNREITLGTLPAGKYQVRNVMDKSLIGELAVKTATRAEPDDYLYAPIDQAYLRKVEDQNVITISGELRSSCMRLTDVKITREPKVIVVQPIAEFDQGPACADVQVPFQRSVVVPEVSDGTYLVHVRSINGHAVNNLVRVRQ